MFATELGILKGFSLSWPGTEGHVPMKSRGPRASCERWQGPDQALDCERKRKQYPGSSANASWVPQPGAEQGTAEALQLFPCLRWEGGSQQTRTRGLGGERGPPTYKYSCYQARRREEPAIGTWLLELDSYKEPVKTKKCQLFASVHLPV